MALRLKVNEELEELEELLRLAPERLRSGRAVCGPDIHVDRRPDCEAGVSSAGSEGRATILTKHVVKPAEEELLENPASRSAKLRALEMNY